MVKYSNSSMGGVLKTLQSTMNRQGGPGQQSRRPGLIGDDDDVELGDVDPEELLDKADVSIKNLNHSLMKLVAVQQESISIAKNLPQGFVMMDRVPAYLELEAAGMPYPCKIVLRPNYRRYGYSEAVQHVVA